MLLGLAGLAMGYAVTSEYPLFFVAVVLGLYLLSRRDAFTPLMIARRAGAYIAGGVVGIVPLLLYNHYAFRSWTHLAYSDVPRQHKGFFGISAPSLKVLATLLFDSRGLLTLSPVLMMGALGTVLLYRRGRRAEALDDRGHLPLLRGLQLRLLPALRRRLHGPALSDDDAAVPGDAAGARVQALPRSHDRARRRSRSRPRCIATITHPLIGYETETVVWVRYLREALFQPTIASAYGLGPRMGRDLAVPARRRRPVVLLAVCASARVRLTPSALGIGVLTLIAWALFAALAPTVLGIDHQGLLSIVRAGDNTALSTKLHPTFSSYPLKALAPIAAAAGLLALAAMRLFRNAPDPPHKRPGARTARTAVVALLASALLCAGAATALAAGHGSRGAPHPTARARAPARERAEQPVGDMPAYPRGHRRASPGGPSKAPDDPRDR